MKEQWKIFNKRMIKSLRFNREGFLIDVILQNCITRDVLFGASMSKETLLESIERGIVVLFSKTQNKRWVKGETSGDYLKLISFAVNCEKNQLLIQVYPVGAGVCHKKDRKGRSRSTCFFRTLLDANVIELNGKYYRIKSRKKTEVEYYFDYGWLSCEELFDLRQTEPRYAP